jgi:rSAM/selenodomain-associated transferase 2
MTLSIIIPTYNESENIPALVQYLFKHGNTDLVEIIVVDAGSTDDTVELAKTEGANAVISPKKGRAVQMNFGASIAKGDCFYFVHADTMPPPTYMQDIAIALKSGHTMGRYLSRYNSKSLLLKINAFLSRMDVFEGMGGDQTLFITRKLFFEAGQFDSAMKIMEEFEFCSRARKLGNYKIIPKKVLISARKYHHNGWLKVQRANYTVVKMYKLGATQDEMLQKYRMMIDLR